MIIRRPSDIPSSEITPESIYVNRRKFMKAAAAGAAGLALGPTALEGSEHVIVGRQEIPARFAMLRSEMDEELNSYTDVTTYNNFYEFGTGKSDPARNWVGSPCNKAMAVARLSLRTVSQMVNSATNNPPRTPYNTVSGSAW